MPRPFIPDGDREFAAFARHFVDHLTRNPAEYHVTHDAVQRAEAVVAAFRLALATQLRPSTATTITRRRKDAARAAAEAEVRRLGRVIRADESIDPCAKAVIGIRSGRHRRRRADRSVPASPPYLRFVGPARDPRKHVLQCLAAFGAAQRRKPAGAERIELFAQMVAPRAAIPTQPADGIGSRLIYLRSFTTSHFEVMFPVPRAEPMLLVYWGRWAARRGEVGPWSKPAVGRIEFAPASAALPGALPASHSLVTSDEREGELAEGGVYIIPPRALPSAAPADSALRAHALPTAKELCRA